MQPTSAAVHLHPLFRRHVRRPRLTRLLDETSSRVILIVAPAGYGKTILAAEWAQTRPHVSWYRATPGSADVAAFSLGVAEAVAPVVGAGSDRLRQRLNVGEPEKAPRQLAEVLAGDLANWPQAAWLVIDDYHFVSDSWPVEEFVERLLELVPLRLLVTARRRPQWARARNLIYGDFLEVGREQLAMTAEEAAHVLQGLSTGAVNSLVARAQGWPALIGLAGISVAEKMPSEQVSKALFRYFAEEVLRQQPPDAQAPMLVAAVATAADAALIRDVLDVRDADLILERLEEEGILQRSSDGLLRFHPLLRDFLLKKLREEAPVLWAAASTRAIANAEERGHWDEAFALTSEAERFETAARIAGAAAPHLLAEGRLQTLANWLRTCGSAAFAEPSAVLAQAELWIRRDLLAGAHGLAQDLAKRLPEDDPLAARAWNLVGQASHLRADEEEALESYRKAKKRARSDDDLKRALFGAFLAALELDVDAAGDFLGELAQMKSAGIDDRLRLATGRVQLATHRGTCRGLWDVVAPLLPLVEHSTDPMRRSAFLKDAAVVCIAGARYRRAYELASEAVAFCCDLGLDFATWLCLAHRAEAEIGLRRFQRARRTVSEARDVLAQHDLLSGNIYLLGVSVKLALAQRRFDEALALAAQVPQGTLFKTAHGSFLALQSIAAAAAGDKSRSRELAATAEGVTGAVEAQYYAAFAQLLCNFGDPTRCVDLVRRAAEDEFLDAFVVAYRVEPALLALLAQEPTTVEIVRSALTDAGDERLGRRAGLDISPGAAAALTPREAEVLSLIAEGLSNVEIAARLFITPSTTKVHVHHILEKLGARNRLDAIVKAEGLLAKGGSDYA